MNKAEDSPCTQFYSIMLGQVSRERHFIYTYNILKRFLATFYLQQEMLIMFYSSRSFNKCPRFVIQKPWIVEFPLGTICVFQSNYSYCFMNNMLTIRWYTGAVMLRCYLLSVMYGGGRVRKVHFLFQMLTACSTSLFMDQFLQCL